MVFGYVLLGATYLIIKTEGAAQQHGVQTAWVAGALMLIAAAGVSLWTPLRYPSVADKWFAHGHHQRFYRSADLRVVLRGDASASRCGGGANTRPSCGA